jgi:SPP1 gp7 family putative phage head morphogenesis protein
VPTRRPPPPESFAEAVAWFREKVPMTREDWDALEEAARARSFTVSGVAQLDLVAEVFQQVDTAIANGDTLADFQTLAEQKLYEAWGREDPWRIETILRTNIQSAYGAGRYEQQQEVKEDRPYWEFSAIMDSRTSEICSELDGKVLPADDPWWRSHNPPLHFNCRSTVMSLTEEQATSRGLDSPPAVDAQDGFGSAPEVDEWEPSAAGYPAQLVEVARDKGVL